MALQTYIAKTPILHDGVEVEIDGTIVLDDEADGNTVEQLLSIGAIALVDPAPEPAPPASELGATASQAAADSQQKGKRGK